MKARIEYARILLYIEALFSLEIFFATVMAPFYLDYIGLKFSQMTLFFSLIMFFNWLLDLPCGIIADRFGRKFSFVVGKLIYLVAMISLFCVRNMTTLYVVAFVFSLGVCLSSGNLSAIVYEYLCSKNQKQYYFTLSTRASSIGFASASIACILGGILGSIDLKIPLIVDSFGLGITIITSLFIFYKMPKDIVGPFSFGKKLGIKEISTNGFSFAFKNDQIIKNIIGSAICFAVLRSCFNFYQPISAQRGLDLAQFGFVLSGLNFIAASFAFLISVLYQRIFTFLSPNSLIVFLLVSSGLIVFFSTGAMGFLLAAVLHQIVRAIADPYYRSRINEAIPENSPFRTTILSTNNTARALSAALVTAISGFIADATSLSLGFFSIAFFGGGLIFVLRYVFANYVLLSRASL